MWAHYSLIIICLNIGSPRNYHFPFETNGKVVVLGVPILKHFWVHVILTKFYCKIGGFLFQKILKIWIHLIIIKMVKGFGMGLQGKTSILPHFSGYKTGFSSL